MQGNRSSGTLVNMRMTGRVMGSTRGGTKANNNMGGGDPKGSTVAGSSPKAVKVGGKIKGSLSPSGGTISKGSHPKGSLVAGNEANIHVGPVKKGGKIGSAGAGNKIAMFHATRGRSGL